MNLVTPLNRVLGLGSAKGGVEHWWVQRLTAAALVPLGLWLAFALAGLDDYSYQGVVAWIAQPGTSVLLILVSLTLAYHSYLGIQVIFEDYVHDGAVKIAVLTLSTFAHVAIAIVALFSILRISFGSVS